MAPRQPNPAAFHEPVHFTQEADPAADPGRPLWPGMWWIDPVTITLKRRNATNSDWDVIASAGGGGGVTDHGALSGLSDDDHPQYATVSGETFTGPVVLHTDSENAFIVENDAGVDTFKVGSSPGEPFLVVNNGAPLILYAGNYETETARFDAATGRLAVGSGGGIAVFEMAGAHAGGLIAHGLIVWPEIETEMSVASMIYGAGQIIPTGVIGTVYGAMLKPAIADSTFIVDSLIGLETKPSTESTYTGQIGEVVGVEVGDPSILGTLPPTTNYGIRIREQTAGVTDWALYQEGAGNRSRFEGQVQVNDLILSEIAAPATPAAGTLALYAKADGHLYAKDDAGTETDLLEGVGGAGGAGDIDHGELLGLADNDHPQYSLAAHTHPNPGIAVYDGATLHDADATTLVFDADGFLLNESPEGTIQISHSFGSGELQVAEGNHNHAEEIRDTMAAALVAGANVTITVSDASNTITIASTGGGGGGVTDHGALTGLADNDHPQYSLSTHDHAGVYAPASHSHGGIPQVISIFTAGGGAAVDSVWTDMPAAQTELLGGARLRHQADLTNATEYRLYVNQRAAGNATGVLRARYSTDGGTTWLNLSGGTSTAGDLGVNTTGVRLTSWLAIDALAIADVLLSVWGFNGNGNADPAFNQVAIHVR